MRKNQIVVLYINFFQSFATSRSNIKIDWTSTCTPEKKSCYKFDVIRFIGDSLTVVLMKFFGFFAILTRQFRRYTNSLQACMVDKHSDKIVSLNSQ